MVPGGSRHKRGGVTISHQRKCTGKIGVGKDFISGFFVEPVVWIQRQKCAHYIHVDTGEGSSGNEILKFSCRDGKTGDLVGTWM